MCDNQTTICIIKNDKFDLKGNHIDHQYYYIFDVVLKNELVVKYVFLKEMIADLLVKAITFNIFKGYVLLVGVKE